MSGLKQLKTQMNTVQTTLKITTAMRMVAVSHLRKSHALLLDAYPYLDEITRMLRRLVRQVSTRTQLEAGTPKLPALIKGHTQEKKHLVLCISSDDGFCGRFNQSVVAMTEHVLNYLQTQTNQKVSVVCFGQKGAEILKRHHADLKIHQVLNSVRQKQSVYESAERMAMNVIDAFYRGDFDTCSVVYSEFKSAALQQIKVEQLVPFQIFHHENKWDFLMQQDEPDYVQRDVLGRKKVKKSDARLFSAIGGAQMTSPLMDIESDALLKESTRLPEAYDYLPSDEKMLEAVLYPFIEAHIYKILLNTEASENAARMLAMENATQNASDMMKQFQKKYHRRRQEIVTKDLTEVVAGSMT